MHRFIWCVDDAERTCAVSWYDPRYLYVGYKCCAAFAALNCIGLIDGMV